MPLSNMSRRALMIGVATSFIGCKRLLSRKKGGTKQLTCPTGEHSITVPAHWSEGLLENDEAEIIHGSNLDATYVIVIAEPKDDFSVDLAGYAEMIADMQEEKFEDATFGPLEPRVIHGMQALVRELRGTLKAVNLVYLSAVVETPKDFVQIQTWTSKSRFEASRPVLLSVIDSFGVIGPKPN